MPLLDLSTKFKQSSNSSRKFVDLIYERHAIWSNINPEKEIKVGDYGQIDKRTGQWEPDGNVYTDEATAAWTVNYQPEIGPDAPGSYQSYYAHKDKARNVSSRPGASFRGGATLKTTMNFQFSKTRGAVIFLAEVQRNFIPAALLKALAKLNAPELSEKSLVTEVISCRACFLGFSDGAESEFKLELRAQVPLTVGAAGGSLTLASKPASNSGFHQLWDFTKDGSRAYVPVFSLKRRNRDSWSAVIRDVSDPEAEN
ncbi:hypothetical protein C8R44DRAFT_807349 [Mycena epipterygia]|nr:hypothetical protein C8R44DRAFT_807349 [Mycena epipterygia]